METRGWTSDLAPDGVQPVSYSTLETAAFVVEAIKARSYRSGRHTIFATNELAY